MTAFTDLPLKSPLEKPLLKALDKLSFANATDVQVEVIPAMLADKDLMVSAKTGSGKTAAFLLPLIQKMLAEDNRNTSTRVLILLPTRELALQTQKTFQSLAAYTYIKSGLIIGGEAYKHQVATLRKNPEVLIATPGRLVLHIENKNTDFSDLEVLILDEADRMLDMGFTDDMNAIAKVCKEDRQTCLFSATLKHKAIKSISHILKEPQHISMGSHRESNTDIKQQKILADDIKHKEKLVVGLIEKEELEKVFIFCNTRVQCEQLGHYLNYKKIKAGYIHGELTQSVRKQVLNKFRDNKLSVLVATDVAARGLDVEGVDCVINFTVPQSGDDYVHRVGRTGRAGNTGTAYTFVTDLEWNLMSSIERYLKLSLESLALKGLKAHYKGPKKLKSSGKAAGTKKKKPKIAASKKEKKRSPKKTVKKPTIKTDQPSNKKFNAKRIK